MCGRKLWSLRRQDKALEVWVVGACAMMWVVDVILRLAVIYRNDKLGYVAPGPCMDHVRSE